MEGGIFVEAFADRSRIVVLDSWNEESLKPWEFSPDEDYRETVGSTIRPDSNLVSRIRN